MQLNFSNVSVLQACSVWFSEDKFGRVFRLILPLKSSKAAQPICRQRRDEQQAQPVSFRGFTGLQSRCNQGDGYKMVFTIPGGFGRLKLCQEFMNNGLMTFWRVWIYRRKVNFSCLCLSPTARQLEHGQPFKAIRAEKQDGLFQSIEERQGHPLSLGVETDSGDRMGAGWHLLSKIWRLDYWQ